MEPATGFVYLIIIFAIYQITKKENKKGDYKRLVWRT